MIKTRLPVGALVLAVFFAANRLVCGAPAGVDLSQCAGWDIVVDAAAVPSELYGAKEL